VASDRDLAPGEWAVLALLCEQPAHGWALAQHLTSSGELGSVWTMDRPLVYRSLEILGDRGLIEAAGHERGARGPNRTIFRATPRGRGELRRWLGEPVDRVRDVRSLLLLKLVFAERLGIDPTPMLLAERAAIGRAIASLETRIRRSHGTEEMLLRFRLESTRAVMRFLEGVLEREAVAAKAAV
jgi:DNA-binding PadR family transcriptional regulator